MNARRLAWLKADRSHVVLDVCAKKLKESVHSPRHVRHGRWGFNHAKRQRYMQVMPWRDHAT